MSKPAHVEKKQDHKVEMTEDRPVFTPATDIYEKEDALLVRCDMPGVDDQHLDIVLEDNVLTLSGSQEQVKREGQNPLMAEYRSGVYHRQFSVPQDMDNERISARIHNGVLELELPKAEKARPKRIQVHAR